jgi:hypothetical protein
LDGYDAEAEATYMSTFLQVADGIWRLVEARYVYFDP